MNIEDEKTRFLGLLRTSYEAKLPHKGGVLDPDPTRISLAGNALAKMGFDYQDSGGLFWHVICPSLEADGTLIEYAPFSPWSVEEYLKTFVPEYPHLIQRRDSIAARLPDWYHSAAESIARGVPVAYAFQGMSDDTVRAVLDEIAEITQRLATLKTEHQGEPLHLFVVNEKKLLERTETKEVTLTPDSTQNLWAFTLTKDGVLARQNPMPGDNPYALEKGSRRHKVLEALIGCKTGRYCKTDDLADGICTPTDFRGACDELKTQFVKHFTGTKRTDIIEGKANSGYRLHSQVRIFKVP